MSKTIQYYNENANAFYETTVHVDMSKQYDSFLKYLSPGASILDFGCGSGRDSKFFLDNNFEVTSIDGSEELCKKASLLMKREVLCKRFLDIEYENKFDGVWACASLLHVSESELPSVFKKIRNALKEGGVLYCSFKYGEKTEERNGRHFTDMTEKKFVDLLDKIEGLEIIHMYITGDVRQGRESEMWLNIVLRNQSVM